MLAFPVDFPAILMSINERTYALGQYEEAKEQYKGTLAQFVGLAHELRRRIQVPSVRAPSNAIPYFEPDGTEAMIAQLRLLHARLIETKATIEGLAATWKFEPFSFGPSPL